MRATSGMLPFWISCSMRKKIDAVIHFAAFSLVASSEKAKRVLDWKPEHDSLEEIIASAWNWHTHHPNGYEE